MRCRKQKKPGGRIAQALKIINTEFALGMTGTPVENGMHELWQIMDILAPGFLSTLKLFKETYDPDVGES